MKPHTSQSLAWQEGFEAALLWARGSDHGCSANPYLADQPAATDKGCSFCDGRTITGPWSCPECGARYDLAETPARGTPAYTNADEMAGLDVEPRGTPAHICQCLCSACASCTGDYMGEDDATTSEVVK
jgi:hypothetical protein